MTDRDYEKKRDAFLSQFDDVTYHVHIDVPGGEDIDCTCDGFALILATRNNQFISSSVSLHNISNIEIAATLAYNEDMRSARDLSNELPEEMPGTHFGKEALLQ